MLYFTARVHHLQDNCQSAIGFYEQSISTTSDNLPIHLQAAECYFLLGNQNRAFEHYKAALNPYTDSNPNSLTYFQYALSAYGTGHPTEAEQLLKMILRFDPNSVLSDRINELLIQLEDER